MRSTRVLAAILLMLRTVAAQDNQPTTTQNNPAVTTSQSQSSSQSSSPQPTSSSSRVVVTGGDSAQTTALPPIAGGNPAAGVTGLPSLSRTRDGAVPTYPPPAVPPTDQAPFMQRSTMPQGTVFIAVGAILGAFGLTVLVWRAIIACLLHRDVERAALAQHMANDKAASFPPPPAPFYKSYNDSGSNPNLLSSNTGMSAAAAAAHHHQSGQVPSASLGRGVRRTNRGPTPSATPSQSNLFFSPTAASGLGGQGGSNRDSRFLPSGFYAAGAGQSSPIGARHEHSISLSNLRPESYHARAVTPPDSPQYGGARPSPSGSGANMPPPQQQRNVSSSTLNLNNPTQGRTPSAYLEDMLDDPNSQLHYLPGGARAHGHNPPPNGGRF